MINTITEMFLSEYFLMSAILGKYLDAADKLFFKLGKLFFLPEKDLKFLFDLTEQKKVKDINTAKDFALYQRIKKYKSVAQIESESDFIADEIITIKGNAIEKAAHLNLVSASEMSHNILYGNLVNYSSCGCIDAMRVLGILQCEGIFIDKNLKAGISNLSKCADWNDVKSIVALLNFGTDKREYNLCRLHMLVNDTPFVYLYEQAKEVYKCAKLKEIDETKLLSKAFHSSVLKQEVYDAKYARVIYSSAISLSDKEKAVFNPNKEVITAISDLPLKVTQKKSEKIDLTALDFMPLQRRGERDKIAVNLGYKITPAYRPLAICSDCKYLLAMYAEALSKEREGVNISHIHMGELSSYELEPTANNIFVRSVDEDRLNVFLMYFEGSLPERLIEIVTPFLQTEKRAKFHLGAPNVTIDFSDVLPIVLCDKANAKKLSGACDVVELADVTQKETPLVVADIITHKKLDCNLSQITLTDDALSYLTAMPADEIESCLDKAIRYEALKSDKLQLNREMLAAQADGSKISNIGFGGKV